MPTNQTYYGNGSVTTDTSQSYPGFSMGAPQGYNYPQRNNQLDAMMGYKMQQAQQEQALRERQMALQEQEADRGYHFQAEAGQRVDRDFAEEAPFRRLQLQAMQEEMRGTPNYVKMVGQGAQGIPGYIQAQAGEPGAVFAGYMPRTAQRPQASSFQGGGGGARRQAEMLEPQRQQEPEPSYEERYFKQFGHMPNQPLPEMQGIYGAQPRPGARVAGRPPSVTQYGPQSLIGSY